MAEQELRVMRMVTHQLLPLAHMLAYYIGLKMMVMYYLKI
jgi:hypothetical protein